MAELYPTDSELNNLSGTNDGGQGVAYPTIFESPYYTTFYKMLYRLLNVTRRAGDLRVYKDGDLTFGVRAGNYLNSDAAVTYSGSTEQSLTDDATNYIYLTATGTLTKNTTGFPIPSVTPHIRLATILTASGVYDIDDITDYRGTSFLSIAGAAAGTLHGLDWQESVLDEVNFVASEPGSPTLGDRYINTATGDSSGTSQSVTANRIYEWNATDWTEVTPNEGAACIVEDRDMLVGYNGSNWVDLGTFALLNEAQTFFNATDVSAAEAETLTDGSNSDALHIHDTAGLEDQSVTAAKMGYAHDAIVIVQHGANDVANGTNLKAAYTAAKSLTPGGSALATDNRAVVYVPAGRYDFGSTAFDVDTDFIDLIGDGTCRKLENGEISFPCSKLICDTDTEVVNVTARDIHMRGFAIEQETNEATKRGLVIDNVNACDRGRFVDIGITMQATGHYAIDDGTNTTISAYFEQCHSLATLLRPSALSGTCIRCTGGPSSFEAFGTPSGTFEDCITTGNYGFGGYGTASGIFKRCSVTGNGGFGGFGTLTGICEDCECLGNDGFGGANNSGTAAVMRRCKSLGRDDAITKWQGLMADCEIEVTTTTKHAVELARDYIGAADRTDNGGGDTNTIVITGDYASEFPAGSFVRHVGEGSWYRVVSAVYSSPDTTIELADAAGATWAARADIRACSAARLIGNTLITADTKSVDTDAESPVLMSHNRVNYDITSDVKNLVGQGFNVIDENLVSIFKEL